MFDSYEWKSKIYTQPLNKMNDLYYKVCCYWNAKTEIYDSILADGFTYFNESSLAELLDEDDDEHPPKNVLSPSTSTNAITDNFFIILPPMNISFFQIFTI